MESDEKETLVTGPELESLSKCDQEELVSGSEVLWHFTNVESGGWRETVLFFLKTRKFLSGNVYMAGSYKWQSLLKGLSFWQIVGKHIMGLPRLSMCLLGGFDTSWRESASVPM